ncbi:MAG: BatD family protein, partial [Verrucomicrobiae bacterium]|nr:BatD family protein [Verrucomicrobiae bacterium]
DTGRGFFGRIEARQLNFMSDPLRIRVLSPPAAGRPASFDGAVGRFQTQVAVSSTNVALGDPITVRISVRGSGNFDGLRLPELPAGSAFQSYPGTNSFAEADPLGLTGTKTFEVVLVPEQPGAHTLRWPVISSWDPIGRKYFTDEPSPLHIHVRPGATPQAQPAGSNVVTLPAPATPALADPSDLALKLDAGTLAVPGASVVTHAWFWTLWGLPLAAYAFAGTFLWWRRRRRDDPSAAVRQRARHAVAESLANLGVHAASGRSEAFYSAVNAALQSQLALTLGGVAGSYTEEVIESQLVPRGLSGEDAGRLRELFAALAQARFAPGSRSGSLSEQAGEAEAAIRALRRLEESR